jgi:hypothetical protein
MNKKQENGSIDMVIKANNNTDIKRKIDDLAFLGFYHCSCNNRFLMVMD